MKYTSPTSSATYAPRSPRGFGLPTVVSGIVLVVLLTVAGWPLATLAANLLGFTDFDLRAIYYSTAHWRRPAQRA